MDFIIYCVMVNQQDWFCHALMVFGFEMDYFVLVTTQCLHTTELYVSIPTHAKWYAYRGDQRLSD